MEHSSYTAKRTLFLCNFESWDVLHQFEHLDLLVINCVTIYVWTGFIISPDGRAVFYVKW